MHPPSRPAWRPSPRTSAPIAWAFLLSGLLAIPGVAQSASDTLHTAELDSLRIRDRASTNQAGLLLGELPGVVVAQGGFNEFLIAPRSFLDLDGRGLLVRVDGRDLGANFAGSPEWAALALTEPGTRLEFVPGPSSALDGANAFGGVLDIRTPTVRSSPGTRVAAALGDLESRDLRGRWAGVSSDLRWGLRVAGGWSSTRGYDESRTGVGDLEAEYARATDETVASPFPGSEQTPLNGQLRTTPDSVPGPAVGEPDAQTTVDGSVRIDRYLTDGGVLTAEGGLTRLENQVVVTESSRRQTGRATVPWARIEIDRDDYRVRAYYAGRTGTATDLASGTTLEDRSTRLEVDGRLARALRGGSVRAALGATARQESVDSEGTLLGPVSDGRTDRSLSAFGSIEWDVGGDIELSAAARVDESSIWDTRFTPHLAVGWSPSDLHAFRVSLERGFETPTVAESFARVQLSQPVDLLDVEALIRGSPLGPSMGGVPDGQLFENSTEVPFLAIGNPELEPATVQSVTAGYRGHIGRTSVTADLRYSEFEDFTSGLLPGVHPDFGRWSPPAAIPGEAGLLVGAFARDVVDGLTRLENGRTAIVYSRTNTGRATQWGLDLSAGMRVGEEVRVDGSYSWVSTDVEDDAFVGAPRSPNTPEHAGTLAASWTRPDGIRARIGFSAATGMDFRDGVFAGFVPGRQSVDLDVRGPLGRGFDVALSMLNVLDQERFHYFGGSVIGRRVVAAVVWSR